MSAFFFVCLHNHELGGERGGGATHSKKRSQFMVVETQNKKKKKKKKNMDRYRQGGKERENVKKCILKGVTKSEYIQFLR